MSGGADDGAFIVRDAFSFFRERFHALTARACPAFERGDWSGARRDAAARLDLYPATLTTALEALAARLGAGVHDRELWRRCSESYGGAIAGLADEELAQTFFNSVTRRLFAHSGVDPAIEFVGRPFEPPDEGDDDILRVCPRRQDTAGAVARLLAHQRFGCGFEDLGRDATRIAPPSTRTTPRRSTASKRCGRCSTGTAAPISWAGCATPPARRIRSWCHSSTIPAVSPPTPCC